MPEHHLPKGISLETLRDILAGWAAVGSAVEPRYTSDVAEETGISDAVGRQTRFLEDIGVLDPRDGQKHALTDSGADLARALADDEDERARRVARDLLDAWPVTQDVRGIVRDNPATEEKLVPMIAALTGHDPESSRVRSGISTLLELLDWAELLERDEQGRYRLPRADEEEAELVDVIEEVEDTDAAAETGTGAEESVEAVSESPSGDVEEIEVALGDDTGVQIRIDGDVDLENVDLPEGVQIETGTEQDSGAPSGAENLETDGGLEELAADGGSVELSEDDGAVHIDVEGKPEITLSLGGGEESETEAAPAETESETKETDESAKETATEESAEAEEVGDEATEPEDQTEEGESETEAEEAEEESESETEETEAEETADEGEEEAAAEESTADTEDDRDESESEGEIGADDIEALLEDATEGSLEDFLQQAMGASVDVEAAGGEKAGSEGEATVSEADRPETSRPGEDAIALSLDLSLDAEPADIESLVRGVRRGLTAERGDAER